MAGVFENALLRRFRATVTDSVKMSSNRASVPEAATAWEGRHPEKRQTLPFPTIAYLPSRDRERA
jgi:hypothetical protein